MRTINVIIPETEFLKSFPQLAKPVIELLEATKKLLSILSAHHMDTSIGPGRRIHQWCQYNATQSQLLGIALCTTDPVGQSQLLVSSDTWIISTSHINDHQLSVSRAKEDASKLRATRAVIVRVVQSRLN